MDFPRGWLSIDIYQQSGMDQWAARVLESYYSTIDITLTIIIYFIVLICELDIANFSLGMS